MEADANIDDPTQTQPVSPWRRLGPTFIVAAVVLGPGSIVNASRVGCEFGYPLLWVVPMAGILMMGMTIAAMTIGVLDKQTPCQKLASRFGRVPALIVGFALFTAIALFQASNNNAMIMAGEGLFSSGTTSPPLVGVAGLLVFNALVIGMLVAGRKGLYKKLEKSMAWLVGIMLLAFSVSMFAAKPDWSALLYGLRPQWPETSGEDSMVSWLGIAALVATTFSVAGAFFQTYQVREKGWQSGQLRTGVVDGVIGIGTLSLMTMILFVTSAAAFHGKVPVGELSNATAVAQQMEPLFGSFASVLFSVGVLAGAISSFVVNALIGGVVLVDAMGKDCRFDSPIVRRATIGTLVFGYLIAACALLLEMNLVRFIVVAQSLTMVTFPILALTLLWHLGTLRDQKISKVVYALVVLGTLVVFAMSVRSLKMLVGF